MTDTTVSATFERVPGSPPRVLVQLPPETVGIIGFIVVTLHADDTFRTVWGLNEGTLVGVVADGADRAVAEMQRRAAS